MLSRPDVVIDVIRKAAAAVQTAWRRPVSRFGEDRFETVSPIEIASGPKPISHLIEGLTRSRTPTRHGKVGIDDPDPIAEAINAPLGSREPGPRGTGGSTRRSTGLPRK